MHFSRQLNCWSLRCSRSIACGHCSNYIIILDLTPGFNILRKDTCKPIRKAFKFWGLVQLILEILWYMMRIPVLPGKMTILYWNRPWGHFNIKLPSYQWCKSHYGNGMAIRSLVSRKGYSSTSLWVSLYWSKPPTPHLGLTDSTQFRRWFNLAEFVLNVECMLCIVLYPIRTQQGKCDWVINPDFFFIKICLYSVSLVVWVWRCRLLKFTCKSKTSRGSFQYKKIFPCIGSPNIKIRHLWDCFIFIIGIPILIRWQISFEMSPSFSLDILPYYHVSPLCRLTILKLMIYKDVSGFAIGGPCSDWYLGLTTHLLYVCSFWWKFQTT